MIDHRSYAPTEAVVKLNPEKKSGLKKIRIHDLYDTSAVLYTVTFDDPKGR